MTEQNQENQPKSPSIAGQALRMAWPSVVESFFIALASMVDTLMVSSIGSAAVAAVGLTTQPKFIVLSFFISMSVALSAVVARRKGERDRESANRALVCALLYVLITGAVISAAAVWFARDILLLCGAQADTIDSAAQYFRIIAGGTMFNIISLTINAAQRGAGNTRIAMTTNVTANIVNMIGNYVLINGHLGFPALGIRGAAIATVFGTAVACVMSIASAMDTDGFISIPYILGSGIGPRLDTYKRLFGIGGNIFLEQMMMRVGFMTTAIMAAKLGTSVIAAHQVGMNVLNLSFSFGDGMQAAAIALIGRSLGEKKPDLAMQYGTVCQRIGMTISVVLAVLYFAGGRWLYGLFFAEADIIAMGVVIMRLMVVIVCLQISQIIYMGCLRGAGDVRYTMMASLISVTIVRVSASVLFCYGFGMGLTGIWLGIAADQLCRFLMASLRFRKGQWTKIKI